MRSIHSIWPLNKVLAGRLEPRDWIDVLNCNHKIQPFGYLVWAACGKDPGFSPMSLLAEASRSHYSQAELDVLDFDGAHPDAAALSGRWHEILRMAREICSLLPASEAGKCVITSGWNLFGGNSTELAESLRADTIAFHEGRIGGSWPTFKM